MIHDIDESRMDKLLSWLHGKGIDAHRLGNDLVMPSPFKERHKRSQGHGPNYVDHNKRLSVRVVKNSNGNPVIVWQCWYTKRPDGKPFGGQNPYALAIRTKVEQSEICQLLDLDYDSQILKDEELTFTEKMQRIFADMADRSKRQGTKKLDSKDKMPWVPPSSLTPMYRGNMTTGVPERILADERGLDGSLITAYNLHWNYDSEEVVFPWYNLEGHWSYHVSYNVDTGKYRYPPTNDSVRYSKSDLIYGLHTWSPDRPLVIGEGVFEALTLLGCAIGGSSLTNGQKSILQQLKPKMIILAMDRDGAGIQGVQTISKYLSYYLPETEVVIVFPPSVKDWSKLSEKVGQHETIRVFCERVAAYRSNPTLQEMMRQML